VNKLPMILQDSHKPSAAQALNNSTACVWEAMLPWAIGAAFNLLWVISVFYLLGLGCRLSPPAATGGGAGDSDADFHGEAVVPEGWIRQNWSGFLVLEVMPPHGDANRVVVIAKKGIRASTAFFTFRMTT
jgi:hypothetical protein